MTRAAIWLLSAGVLLFVGVLASQGLPAVFATFAQAGWGLLLVALFHLLPLALDAAAIRVLFDAAAGRVSLGDAVLARWAGESANSFMPAGQIGGPVLMVRQLVQREVPMPSAVAAITVSTTLQTFAQVLFTLVGVVLVGIRKGPALNHGVRVSLLVASGVLILFAALFYRAQRRGMFSGLARTGGRFFTKLGSLQLQTRAESIDLVVRNTYADRRGAAASFGFSVAGWLAGTGEVYLILHFLGYTVDLYDALLLESLGQAIRGAAFAIPGALGVQEGGYLLLAPLVGLPPHAALALSLAKRAREVLLGVPGLLYMHFSERVWRRRAAKTARPALL